MTDKTEKKTDTSSANNSIAEFVKATSVAESNAEAPGEPAKQAPMDGSTEVSPMDRGAEDELDGSAPPKEARPLHLRRRRPQQLQRQRNRRRRIQRQQRQSQKMAPLKSPRAMILLP
ncbi:MAG: hypothetical protein C0508_30400 [Cyanobacteria bacterium PR.023]|nr:hypothetical protein [Cyanobacteria bacterium PR.023]